MPSFCSVLDCDNKYSHGKNVRFHKFPTKNNELLEKWINFTLRPKGWIPTKWMSVCGLHFLNEDYRCLNQKKLLKKDAFPSVRHVNKNATSQALTSVESEEEPYLSDIAESATKCIKFNSKCRFCGVTNSTFFSFEGNFEIFGVIQKCLPTLANSITQDDSMPKEICRQCLKRLKNFAGFIDKIVETQTAVQQQLRNTKTNERMLKIKQEPVVRVKQENIDEVNALFPDEVDDGCGCGEQDNATIDETQMDQKFQFWDFPVLNDHEMINNCDIMEIINLSEPLIDITHCENTVAEKETLQQQQHYSLKQKTLSSANETLQLHHVISEHNYANFSEELKEEWPTRQYCKKEKIEADEYEVNVSLECSIVNDSTRDINTNVSVSDYDVAATITEKPTSIRRDECERSNKPIITSVSSLSEGTMLPTTTFPNTEEHQISRKKPNIVVINESIVQSSGAFKIHACTTCPSTFFSIDSLNHHYFVSHNLQVTQSMPTTQPMVIVPNTNLTSWDKDKQQGSQMQCQSYKTEKDCWSEMRLETKNLVGANTNQSQTQVPPKRSAKNEIKILDMQQSFLQHQYHNPSQLQLEQSLVCNQQQVITTGIPKSHQLNEHNIINSTVSDQHTNTTNTAKKKYPFEPEFDDIHPQFSTPDYTSMSSAINTEADVEKAKYLELKKEYLTIKRKYYLLKNRYYKKGSSRKTCFSCHFCALEFLSVFQLLRHKQLHRIRKSIPHFFATCAGCKKFFFRKIAFNNHMRYICQSLPLRWLKNQIPTFKCRFCRSIKFTHWRIYRKHELKCQYRMKQKSYKQLNTTRKSNQLKSRRSHKIPYQMQILKAKCTKAQPLTRKQGPKKCDQCKKMFPTLSSLNQHLISHTNLKTHKCDICQRVFKRRHGLSQHISSFHWKLKPFECPICKHKYALKGDMKRCKHSDLTRKNVDTKRKSLLKT